MFLVYPPTAEINATLVEGKLVGAVAGVLERQGRPHDMLESLQHAILLYLILLTAVHDADST